MTDRTCKTCKHWSQHPWPNRRGWHPYGTCAALQIAPQGHLLNKAPEGHMPMVDTNYDFGCNKWEGERREGITALFPEFGKPDLIVSLDNTAAQFNAATEAWAQYTKKLLRTVEEIMREDCR